MNNAVVIGGLGMVGQATMRAFGIDKFIDTRDTEHSISYQEAGGMKYVFLCLPTPTVNGECDTSLIREAIQAVLDFKRGQPIFIIRSTVVPGTTRSFVSHFGIDSIVHNPEFLSEDTWKDDTDHPDVIVVGCDHPAYLEDVEALYKGRYKGVDIYRTDSLTSEMVKYAANSFYTMKVVFANQIYDMCQKNGANYERIKEVMYKRKWIGNNHLDVFHKGKRGAGGKCLPKDSEAFANYSQLDLLKKVVELNKMYLGGQHA